MPVVLLLLLVAGAAGAVHAADITAVPPATAPLSAAAKATAVVRPLVEGPRRAIVLSPPSDSETAQLKAGTARSSGLGKGRPLTIGIGRMPELTDRDARGADLTWTALSDGNAVARIDVTSAGAKGVRLGLVMRDTHPDVTVRFAGSAPGAPIFGPYPANVIAETAATEGMYWTPVLEGSTGSIELEVPSGVNRNAIVVAVVRVSHLFVVGAELFPTSTKLFSDIGTSDSCEIDVACVAGTIPAVTSTQRSIVKLVFTLTTGASGTCTGTLINDSTASLTPYIYTANHCLDSQSAASTLNSYWFFEAATCGSRANPPGVVLLAGGAMLLGRSKDHDWSIVRLRSALPAGVQYAAWRAEPLATQLIADTLHHPEGDLLKWSRGAVAGYEPSPIFAAGSFAKMIWSQGSTEFGSSGAGLFTLAAGGAFYELRGGLYAGNASCSNRQGHDFFSRLDKALPLMKQYLTPDVVDTRGVMPVVEFYNRSLDHYFMTINPGEINDLDQGVHAGWERTGLRFLAYSQASTAPADATPVCRFYLRPEVGDSHFYSADPAECAQTAQRFGESWVEESPAVFYIQLPDKQTGACPATTHPVYRFFHAVRTNHRYTAEVAVRNDVLLLPGYAPEGYGLDAVIMCTPDA